MCTGRNRRFTAAFDYCLRLSFFCSFLCAPLAFSQDTTPPALVFNPISIQLDAAGLYTLTTAEAARIAAGSTDPSGITSTIVTPNTFTFCNVGTQTVTLTLADARGNLTNRLGPIFVLAPSSAPKALYVDVSYPSTCAVVAFPLGAARPSHFVGLDAFNNLQAAIDHAADHAVICVAPGTYAENVVISKPLTLLGPNTGLPGAAASRRREAKFIPARNDPENAPIFSIESDDVFIDGFLFDGANPALSGGYNANGVMVHAAAAVQNGVYPDLADVQRITIQNNVITNLSYDGVCLDRYLCFGTSSAWNFILDNRFDNMWEGILTYALDAMIARNVISNVTHGIGVHVVNTAAPAPFVPLVAANTLTIGQWWPVEIDATRAPGIWINFRRERASPIDVVDNIINTPVPPPPGKTIIGLFALTIDGPARVNFIHNIVNGAGNCSVGLRTAACSSNSAVSLLAGSLNHIRDTAVLADTLDPKWGAANSSVTVSNVAITLGANATGVLALHQGLTPANSASVTVISNTSITGGSVAIQVRGPNATATVRGNQQTISGNMVGVEVSAGRALIEGNNLAGNSLGAIRVESNALVDAGDCSGANFTRLGTGSGLNGSSAGLNDLSGYGFDGAAPWAIINSGTLAVRADHNLFGAGPGDNLLDAVAGAVTFSQSDALRAAAPPALELQCFGQIPAPAITLEEFLAAGGSVTAGSLVTIKATDTLLTNRPGQYKVTRRYTLMDACSPAVTCEQIINVLDTQAPTLHCSGNIVQPVDKGCDFATVTFTNLAADSCGELNGAWVPVSTGRFPIGTNTVIVIATDLANNTLACTFDIAVIGPPIITRQPLSRTNNAGTLASFKVVASSAAPLSFQWKRDGAPLCDGGRISGATNDVLCISAVCEADAADYTVDVINFAGVTSSAKAHLEVTSARATLQILSYSNGLATLSLAGPGSSKFAILCSSNLRDWLPLQTNTAPCIFPDRQAVPAACRFYRALPLL